LCGQEDNLTHLRVSNEAETTQGSAVIGDGGVVRPHVPLLSAETEMDKETAAAEVEAVVTVAGDSI